MRSILGATDKAWQLSGVVAKRTKTKRKEKQKEKSLPQTAQLPAQTRRVAKLVQLPAQRGSSSVLDPKVLEVPSWAESSTTRIVA